MTEEEKRAEIKRLYHQLDMCGQMIAEDDEWGAHRRELNKEYKRIVQALRRLEPEVWKVPSIFKSRSEMYDEKVVELCKEKRCLKCGGTLKQTRKGSLRVVCTSCGVKYQLRKTYK